jgi:eukaryotic-like serine/threonine-protein kinase
VLEGPYDRVAFRSDSRQAAVTGADGMVRLYDLPSGQEHGLWPSGQPGGIIRWNPKRAELAMRVGSFLKVFHVETGKILLDKELLPSAYGHWVDWHPGGVIVAVGEDRKITLLDTRTGQPTAPPLEGHGMTGGLLFRFNRAGDRLVSNDWWSILRIWDTRTGRQLLTLPSVTQLQFRGDDAMLAADLMAPKARLLRCSLGQEFYTLPPRGAVRESFSLGNFLPPHKDGRLLSFEIAHRGAALIDVARGEELARLPLQGSPLRFDDSGDGLWTVGPHGLLRWPVRSDPATFDRYHLGPPQRLAALKPVDRSSASADVNRIAIPNYDQGALLWQRERRRMIRLGPQRDIRHCAVSPDGRWVATGSHNDDGVGAKVWNGESGEHVADLRVPGLCVVGFSPDGKWLMTTGGRPRLWQVGTWREGPALGGSFHNPGFAFTADGKLLALGDAAPGVVRLLIPDTGKELARLTAPEQALLHPHSFTTDGGRLITVGRESGALHIFDVRTIRTQLAELGLDWDAPPLPPASKEPLEPLEVQVELGNFLQQAEADRLVTEATRLSHDNKYVDALAALRQAVETDPENAMAHNNLAWQLLVGSKELRDSKAALPFARKAVELAPKALYLNTLGVALFRNGLYDEAVVVLEKSLAAAKGQSDAFDLFVLAMCHHRLGGHAKSKDCYDRAVRWFDEKRGNLPANWVRELTEFQADADATRHGPPN